MRSDRFLKACRREQTDCTPIWIMRQAGRYLPEYREMRQQYNFLDLCKTPEASAEVTLQPLKRFDLDAAILFADIMLPLEGMGVDFDIVENVGPVIENPIRTEHDVAELREIRAHEAVPYVLETVQILRKRLENAVPLIGFSGAPFTLASYMIEGRPSKNFLNTKKLMLNEPKMWQALMEKLTAAVIEYLRAQIEAGAQAIQLFDSWVGALGPRDYRQSVMPYTRQIFDEIGKYNIPMIHFGVITSTLFKLIRETGPDVIGVDWRSEIGEAWDLIGPQSAVQGNLDPTVLFASQEVIHERVSEILSQTRGRPGHIFNLGHGIMPDTPPENVKFLVDLVHKLSS